MKPELLPRTVRLQPAEFVDHITDDGHEMTKLPYPFYVYQTGRVALQASFWRGTVKTVIGFQKDLAKHTIDLFWDTVWDAPQSAVGMYVVTSSAAGVWSVHSTAIKSALASEQSSRSMTRDEAVAVRLTSDWLTAAQIHDRVTDDGWDWGQPATRNVLDRLVAEQVAVAHKAGRVWEFREAKAGINA
jgi:hypothetical protein